MKKTETQIRKAPTGARNSKKNVPEVGGIIPILKQVKCFKLPELIEESLNEFIGKRPKQAEYSYSDIIIGWFVNAFCGGKRLSHIKKYELKLSAIPDLKIPTHHTLGRVMKKMTTSVVTREVLSKENNSEEEIALTGRKTKKVLKKQESDFNKPLNKLLIKFTKQIKMIKPGIKYTLDMDATPIETEVYESKPMRKGRGLLPMVSCINLMPVYIEMRNGNVSPGTRILDCVQESIDMLKEQDIEVGTIRMDGASYNGEVLDYLDQEGIEFMIAAKKSSTTIKKILAIDEKDWKSEIVHTKNINWDVKTSSISIQVKNSKPYRLVVIKKEDNKETHGGWFKEGECWYKIIITNDYKSSEKLLIEFYHQRGTAELDFSNMKNNYGWKYPPFSNLNQNSVFFIISAMTANLYQSIIRKFKHMGCKTIEISEQLENFISNFIKISFEIIGDDYVFNDPRDIGLDRLCLKIC